MTGQRSRLRPCDGAGSV